MPQFAKLVTKMPNLNCFFSSYFNDEENSKGFSGFLFLVFKMLLESIYHILLNNLNGAANSSWNVCIVIFQQDTMIANFDFQYGFLCI